MKELNSSKKLLQEYEALKEENYRLISLIEEHNDTLICDKERCGYKSYKRDCPECPNQYKIKI